MQSCMVLGEGQQCHKVKDCNPKSCRLGFVLCFDRKCVCPERIKRNISK